MVITRNYQGAYVISDVIDGYRVQRAYFGYTKKEAIRLFKEARFNFFKFSEVEKIKKGE